MVTTFPLLTTTLSLSGTFFMFSMTAVLATLFGVFILPETRGKTLEDINNMFHTRHIINNPCAAADHSEAKYSSVNQETINWDNVKKCLADDEA